MNRGTGPYRIPDALLTAQARSTVDRILGDRTRDLHAQLDRQAARDGRRGDPEHRYTSNDVLVANAALDRDPAVVVEEPPAARSAMAAPIMVTLGSVGCGVMPHFLHSPWQWGLFLLLVLVGLIGLGLTWVVGTKAKRGSPPGAPRVAAPTARAD